MLTCFKCVVSYFRVCVVRVEKINSGKNILPLTVSATAVATRTRFKGTAVHVISQFLADCSVLLKT